jgi:hypothetical protein
MINKQSEKPRPNLGQKEAKLEKARKESLGHMEDDQAAQRRKSAANEPQSPKR